MEIFDEAQGGKKAVVIVSGGMDSVTLLGYVAKEGYEPHVLSFDYGQKHVKELDCAKNICDNAEVPWKKVDLSDVNKLLTASALSGEGEIPEGHYAEANMKATVVPSRNTFMLSIASAYAVSIGAEDVFFGAHAGDHAIYPDCREDYVSAMNSMLALANFTPVKVHAPFLKMDKGDIAKLGVELGVPYEQTWTCYKGEDRPCMKCGACIERCEAFQKAGVADPLLTAEEWEEAKTTYSKFKQEYDAKQKPESVS